MRFSRVCKLNFFQIGSKITTVRFHCRKLKTTTFGPHMDCDQWMFDASEAKDGSIMGYVNETTCSLDISTQDENVGILAPVDCKDFFYAGEDIQTIEFDDFYAYDTTSMACMFQYLTSLESVCFNNQMHTIKLTNVAEMFLGCINLTEIHGFRNFNMSRVKKASKMFAWCEKLKEIDLTKCGMPNCELMTYMCYGCIGLSKFTIFRDDTLKLKDAAEMFGRCGDLQISVLEGLATNKRGVYDFLELSSMLAEGIYSEFLPERTRNLVFGEYGKDNGEYEIYASEHFSVFGKIWHRNEEKLEKVTRIFFGNYKVPKGVQPLDYSMEEDGTILAWISNKTDLYITATDDRVILAPQSCMDMFEKCYNVEEIYLTNFDTGHVIGFSHMFYYLEKLRAIYTPYFLTGSATNMAGMFEGCRSLKIIEGLEKFDTVRVLNYSRMFKGCESLETLDLSGFAVSQFSRIQEMVSGCTSLTTLDITSWDIGFHLPYGSDDFAAYCPNLRRENIIWEKKDNLSVEQWNILFGALTHEPKENADLHNIRKERSRRSLERIQNRRRGKTHAKNE